MIAVLQAPRPG